MSLVIGTVLGLLAVGAVVGAVGVALFYFVKPLFKKADTSPENL